MLQFSFAFNCTLFGPVPSVWFEFEGFFSLCLLGFCFVQFLNRILHFHFVLVLLDVHLRRKDGRAEGK